MKRHHYLRVVVVRGGGGRRAAQDREKTPPLGRGVRRGNGAGSWSGGGWRVASRAQGHARRRRGPRPAARHLSPTAINPGGIYPPLIPRRDKSRISGRRDGSGGPAAGSWPAALGRKSAARRDGSPAGGAALAAGSLDATDPFAWWGAAAPPEGKGGDRRREPCSRRRPIL